MTSPPQPQATPESAPGAEPGETWYDHYYAPWYAEMVDGTPWREVWREHEFTLLRRTLPRPGSGPVLDLCCGQGAHSRFLACELGHEVIGLDRATSFLQAATEVEIDGLGPLPTYVRGDMAALPFASGTFSAVIVMLNSFGILGAREAWHELHDGTRRRPFPIADDPNTIVLGEIARVLRPGGLALLDLPGRRHLAASVRKQPVIRYTTATGVVDQWFRYCPRARVLRNETRVTRCGGSQPYVTGYFARLYDPAELRAMCAEVGLAALSFLGDHEGAPWSRDAGGLIALLGRPRWR